MRKRIPGEVVFATVKSRLPSANAPEGTLTCAQPLYHCQVCNRTFALRGGKMPTHKSPGLYACSGSNRAPYEWSVEELRSEVTRLSTKAQSLIARQINTTGTKYLSTLDLEVTQDALRAAYKLLTHWAPPKPPSPTDFLTEIGL